jgi:hypothetical protein
MASGEGAERQQEQPGNLGLDRLQISLEVKNAGESTFSTSGWAPGLGERFCGLCCYSVLRVLPERPLK